MRYWKPRAGTNLNKFTKSSETATEVILTNSPDAITEAGTGFTADAMNNIEKGLAQASGRASMLDDDNVIKLESIAGDGIINYNWAVFASRDGSVYASSGSDIYKKSATAETFSLIQTLTGYTVGRFAEDSNGGIWVSLWNESNYDAYIYIKSLVADTFGTAGLSPFPDGQISGMAFDENDRLYVALYDDNVYYKNAGENTFTAGTLGADNYTDMCKDSDNNIYLTSSSLVGVIYKKPAGSSSFSALTALGNGRFQAIGADFSGGVYVCKWADIYNPGFIYEITGSTLTQKTFTEERYFSGITFSPVSGWLFSTRNYGSIYKQKLLYTYPDDILVVPISGSSVTIPDARYRTIKLTGILTEVCNLIFPTDQRSYNVINACTGAYAVTAKTPSGTGVAIPSGNTLDIYSDGTNIKTTGENYSTTESVTGKYFLGYPVYSKVVNFGALPNATTKSVAHGISGTFTPIPRGISGMTWNSSSSYLPLPVAGVSASISSILIELNGANVNILTGIDRTAYSKCYVTIEYIKAAL